MRIAFVSLLVVGAACSSAAPSAVGDAPPDAATADPPERAADGGAGADAGPASDAGAAGVPERDAATSDAPTEDAGATDGAVSDAMTTDAAPSCDAAGCGPRDDDWPDHSNRPTVSGETLSWVGPLGGGPNDGQPTLLSRSLTPSGPVTSTADGQIIEGLDISGTVEISHNHVTLRQCRIRVSSFWGVAVDGGAHDVTIEDVEIDGQNGFTDGMSALYVGVTGSPGACPNLTIRRTNIHGACDGMSIGYGPVLFRDNWIHDLATSGAGHINGVQWNGASTGGLIDIEHNHVENANDQTDALMFDDFYPGVFGNYTINGNLLRGGGDFTLYSTNSFNHSPPTNITITNNVLNKTAPYAADYLYPTGWAATTYANNLAEETGESIPQPPP